MDYPVSASKEIKLILGGAAYVCQYHQSNRHTRVTHMMQDIARRIEWGYIDHTFMDICHGIMWGMETSRVDASVSLWLKSRSVLEVITLLQELREHCKRQKGPNGTMLTVIFYLNTIQVQHLGYDKAMYPIYKRVPSKEKGGEKDAPR